MLMPMKLRGGVQTQQTSDSISYLTSSDLSGCVKHNNGPTWSDTENAVYFDGQGNGDDSSKGGGWLSLAENPFKKLGITKDTGCTISVEAKIDNSITNWGRIFDFDGSMSSNYRYFFLNAGGGGFLRVCYNYSNAHYDGEVKVDVNKSSLTDYSQSD